MKQQNNLNNIKQCLKCLKYKELSYFYKDKSSKDGCGALCKSCENIRGKNKYIKYKEEMNLRSHEYYIKNKEKTLERTKKYGKENKEHLNEKTRERRALNKEKHRERDRKYEKTEKRREYKRKRSQDIDYRLKHSIRRRVNSILRGKVKGDSATKCLGILIPEFKNYLQSKFYPNPLTGELMSWNNYGIYGWHIDHILPLSMFDLTNSEEMRMACHYTNLQPLWCFDNIKKGNKIILSGFY